MTSRWPIWRTQPVGAGGSWWPAVTGSVAVIIVPPLLSHLMEPVIIGLSGSLRPTLNAVAGLLMASPLLTWAALIVCVPVSHFAAKRGYAGWGVAALCGAIIGAGLANGVRLRQWIDASFVIFALVGVMIALIYWLAIRLVHPNAIGLPTRKPAG